MKSLRAIRDSRKYFLTFVTVVLITAFYVRLDNAATEYEDRMENFKTWGWVIMAAVTGYLGANALQHGLMGPQEDYNNGSGDTIIINKKEQEIPEK